MIATPEIISSLEKRLPKGYEQADGHGADCNFYILDDKWGIKFGAWGTREKREDDRDRMYFRQRRAAQYGVAPKVGERVNLPEVGKCGFYGFVVERASTCRDENMGYYLQCYLAEHAEKELFRATGFCYSDRHQGNYGYLKGNRKFVRIDFGDAALRHEFKQEESYETWRKYVMSGEYDWD